MFCHTKIFFNNNTETEYTCFGTYLCLLCHTFAFDIKALVVPWHQFCIPSSYHEVPDSILHVIICEAFTSKVLLHFCKQEKVRRCQVRTVRRMLEDVPMELLTQQGLCLPGSMPMCIVVQQNNSTRELALSAK